VKLSLFVVVVVFFFFFVNFLPIFVNELTVSLNRYLGYV
jgi:hypothetical protein